MEQQVIHYYPTLDYINIVTCWLATRRIICGFWILCSVYWINRQAEFTITYYSLNLTVNTLR
jgi:hypothetical protein